MTPQEALLARILIIRNAKRTIDISSFFLSHDQVGNLVLDEREEAIARGVNVRILVDSLGTIAWRPRISARLHALAQVKGGGQEVHHQGSAGEGYNLTSVLEEYYNHVYFDAISRNFWGLISRPFAQKPGRVMAQRSDDAQILFDKQVLESKLAAMESSQFLQQRYTNSIVSFAHEIKNITRPSLPLFHPICT